MITTHKVSPRNLVLIVLVSLALSVTFFAPRLWLMRNYVKGSFQWDRAQTFLQQCEQPLRRDIEPAMQWRLLPPLVCHGLGLPGKAPLALPWLGVIVVTTYVAALFRRRLDDWRFVAGGTLLFATTSAVLVPVGWLGINDAWVWLGLLAVAFGRAAWATPLACLFCPWVDERFMIGFPLAWLVARLERREPIWGPALQGALWLLPYAALRLAITRSDSAVNTATLDFLGGQLKRPYVLLPLVPLGWWLGLRAAWAAVAYAVWTCPRDRIVLGALTLTGTLLISVLLASDLSRSIAVLAPAVLLGCFDCARRFPADAPRVILALGVANLLIPAAHVVYLQIDPINPLPIELIRFLRLA